MDNGVRKRRKRERRQRKNRKVVNTMSNQDYAEVDGQLGRGVKKLIQKFGAETNMDFTKIILQIRN